jgi:Kef-type K+ transport system membrane component KefB
MLTDFQLYFEDLSPLLRLVIGLSIVLIFPRLFQKVNLPGVLSLILAGVMFGPYGLHLFKENGEVLLLFSLLGKLMLMFFSGLDIETDELINNWKKSLLVAALSFVLPATCGFLIGFLFDFPILMCCMVAILFSSHSVDITIPILQKLGIHKDEQVSVTLSATAITDILSLVAFTVCLPIHMEGFSWGPFLLQLLYILLFIPLIIYGLKWLSKRIFRKLGESPSDQMIFMLAVLTIAAVVAELVNMEPIVGAFLAGLAVSRVLPHQGIRHQLDVLGNTLFIPSFFISLGMLINPEIILQTLVQESGLVMVVVATILLTKFMAAWLAGQKLNYRPQQRLLMGAMMTPQVASTLAVALVAYESLNSAGERLLNETWLNVILVLMVISAIVGTIGCHSLGSAIVKDRSSNQLQSNY